MRQILMVTAKLTEGQRDEYERVVAKIDEYVDRSDLENPHLGPDAAELDSMTASEFSQKCFDSPLASYLINSLTQGLLGVEAEEVGALYLVDYIKSGTGLENITSDGKDGGQYLRNRQGEPHLPERLGICMLDRANCNL